ncbi:MAG: hypothetical protein ABIJ91_03040 [Candidatus Kuenenbacteria bacterium]
MQDKQEIKILDQKSEEKIKKQEEFKKKANGMRESYRHRAFVLMLELAAIIALPAFAALIIGKKIDARMDGNLKYTLLLLGLAFILSWAVIIIKYAKFNKHIKQVDEQIKKEKEKNNL